MTKHIHLSVDQIPEIREPMVLLKLGDPVLAHPELVKEIIRAVAPDAERKEGTHGAWAAYDGKRLVAFVHPKTGETTVFPALEALQPGVALADRARVIAERLVKDAALFPQDSTKVVALAPMTLVASNHSRHGEAAPPKECLSYVRIERQVNGLPVFGPGTRAMFAIAHDSSIRAFAHRWRNAAPSGEAVAPHSREEIAKAILAQLAAFSKTADVMVDKVSVGYYDGGARYLQPVYRFQATITSHDRELHAAKRHVFGHVSIGHAPEELPVLGKRHGPVPHEPAKHAPYEHAATPAHALQGALRVGRYVVREDSQGWVDSANSFFSLLQASEAVAPLLGRQPIPFANAQYYWAEPRLFLDEKDSFVNSVHIALTEVHGNWGLFSTRDNHDDLVRLRDIPSTGYGGSGGGSLAYWILHSCEVIPTQTDESTSFDVWWNVFNGLHAVLGYRTEMWIGDGVTSPFALAIGLGAPMVPAWLQAVVSDDSYGADDATYLDDNFNPKKIEPMGRASAVAVCGHGDDTATDVEPLGRATCLTEWWFNN